MENREVLREFLECVMWVGTVSNDGEAIIADYTKFKDFFCPVFIYQSNILNSLFCDLIKGD